jgi:predicted dehydrogenase
MKRIRYAVVGLGHISQVAAALVSGDAEELKQLGRKYKVEQLFCYDRYDDALAEVDAAYIAVPNHFHRDYAVRAANAGVHVLCEKPMAVDEEECKEMIDVAEENM